MPAPWEIELVKAQFKVWEYQWVEIVGNSHWPYASKATETYTKKYTVQTTARHKMKLVLTCHVLVSMVWLCFANCSKLVEHALCQGLVHVFGYWNDGHLSIKVTKIPQHFPVERRRARGTHAAKYKIGCNLPSPQICLGRQNCTVNRYFHLVFHLVFLAHFLAYFWPRAGSQLHAEKIISSIQRFFLSAITLCQERQALSMTPLMDAWAVSDHRHY